MAALQAENARLIALLEAHGIAWRVPVDPIPVTFSPEAPSRLCTDEKVALFRRLFRGRTDVYRIESKDSDIASSIQTEKALFDDYPHP